MKTLLCSAFVLLFASGTQAQTRPTPHEWNATIRAVDDLGRPVRGAEAWVSYSLPPSTNRLQEWGEIAGTTDTNGIFTAAHKDRSVSIGFHVRKSGYYPAATAHFFGFSADDPKVNWNATQTLVLRRIGHPIAMYAKLVDEGPPAIDKAAGYDLTLGDWVAPYGKGVNTDILFAKTLNMRSQNDYESKLTVSFPNPGDGIQEWHAPQNDGSPGSPYEAPEAGYQPGMVKKISAHPGQASKFDYDENRIYFFRVRTVLDEKGKVKSALYGRIRGDFMQFRYYLNPTANSRNVEFAPGQNLLKGLKPTERVDSP